MSTPEALARVDDDGDGEAGTVMGRPWAFSDRLTSSLSMRARVSRTRASTSSEVMPFVGMGSRTARDWVRGTERMVHGEGRSPTLDRD